jgi:hypothetical protein
MIRRIFAVATATAAICLTGCSDTHTSAPTDLAPVDALRVGLTEWTVVVPRTPVTPGEVRLEVTNVGATAHDLVVTGTRGTWRTPLLDPGESSTLVVETADAEVLHLECRVAGHHSAGMHEKVTVAGAD